LLGVETIELEGAKLVDSGDHAFVERLLDGAPGVATVGQPHLEGDGVVGAAQERQFDCPGLAPAGRCGITSTYRARRVVLREAVDPTLS
jgi:hypothetical protein